MHITFYIQNKEDDSNIYCPNCTHKVVWLNVSISCDRISWMLVFSSSD